MIILALIHDITEQVGFWSGTGVSRDRAYQFESREAALEDWAERQAAFPEWKPRDVEIVSAIAPDPLVDSAIEAITCACQILDVVKQEWSSESQGEAAAWSEFDQQTRDKLSDVLRLLYEKRGE